MTPGQAWGASPGWGELRKRGDSSYPPGRGLNAARRHSASTGWSTSPERPYKSQRPAASRAGRAGADVLRLQASRGVGRWLPASAAGSGPVPAERCSCFLDVHPMEAEQVLPEDLPFGLVGQLWVAIALAEIFGDLEVHEGPQ